MKKVIPRPSWRCRREEYLRATGRRDELISEGYETAPSSAQWTVVPGGRHANREGCPRPIRLCLVKRATS
jgi:hypothetical protein